MEFWDKLIIFPSFPHPRIIKTAKTKSANYEGHLYCDFNETNFRSKDFRNIKRAMTSQKRKYEYIADVKRLPTKYFFNYDSPRSTLYFLHNFFSPKIVLSCFRYMCIELCLCVSICLYICSCTS